MGITTFKYVLIYFILLNHFLVFHCWCITIYSTNPQCMEMSVIFSIYYYKQCCNADSCAYIFGHLPDYFLKIIPRSEMNEGYEFLFFSYQHFLVYCCRLPDFTPKRVHQFTILSQIELRAGKFNLKFKRDFSEELTLGPRHHKTALSH